MDYAISDFVEDTIIETPIGGMFTRRWGTTAYQELAPIIVFHDSLGSVEQWRDFPAKLSAKTGRSVIAYDRIGFGRSDAHPNKLDTDFIADEAQRGVLYLREALDISKMVLLGHSVGGGMAICTAAAFPEYTEAAVTIAAQAFVEDRTVAGIREAKAAFQSQSQLERLAKYHGTKARWVLEAWTETWLSEAFSTWSLDATLKAVNCPLLVMHGDQDEYGSSAHPNRIGALSSGDATTVLMENVHHMPHREQPDEVIKHISDFLE